MIEDDETLWCFCERCEQLWVGLAGQYLMHHCPLDKRKGARGYAPATKLKTRYSSQLNGAIAKRGPRAYLHDRLRRVAERKGIVMP